MPEQTQAIAISPSSKSPVTSFAPANFGELVKFAEMVAASDLAPKDYKQKPANVIIAIQIGAELGIPPMQAIQNIAVINGRGAVWGDLQLAVCMSHPAWASIEEVESGTPMKDDWKMTCTVLRKGNPPVIRAFSVADAKTAKLWEKDSPWKTYPKRMLQMRARGFALRDAFPDALKGTISVEEAQDYPVIEGGPLVEQAKPAPATETKVEVDPQEELITREEATELWNIAKAAGHNVEQYKAALKDVGKAEKSSDIKRRNYDAFKSWATAKPNPDAEGATQK